MSDIKTIILSRTDSLGDVVLSIPVAGAIKKYNKNIKIIFIGKTYSKAVIEVSENIDEFVNFDEILKQNKQEQINSFKKFNADAIIHIFPNKIIAKLAKLAKIPVRVGTSHRFFHLLTCNKRPDIGRKKSDLHETELNLKLLEPLGIKFNYSLSEIPELYSFTKFKKLDEKLKKLISNKRINLIIHPKSKGSAREWGIDNFQELIEILPENKFKIFVTGTSEEAMLMSGFLQKNSEKIIDLTGRLSLEELISFISKTDALVAASTGPLHIAAATGIKAIGLFAPMRPIHPGRWKPIGKKAEFIVIDKKNCNDCKYGGTCTCILSISASQVYQKLIDIKQ